MTSPPPSSPDSSAPATPPAATPVPVGNSPSTAAAMSDLAAQLDAPQPVYANVIKGTVVGAMMTGSPPTISVQLSGDTSTTVDGVRFIDSYSPVVGDTALIVKQGADIFALGQMNDSKSGVSNGWQTPSLAAGASTNGNANGPVQYRLIVDNGDNKVQLKGSVALSGAVTALWTMAGVFVPSSSRTVLVARDPVAGTVSAEVTFSSTGVVSLAVSSAASSTGSTSPGGTGAVDPVASGTDGAGAGDTTNGVGNHTHLYSNAAGVTTTSGQSADHFHHMQGNHAHTISGGLHSHDQGSHAHPLTAPSAPVWLSFNDVEFFV